jgi:hypothetical protein
MDQRGQDLRPWQSWVLPLAGGLVAATVAATLTLPSLSHPLTWTRLVSRSALMLVLSASTAAAGASLLRRVFDGCFEALRSDLLACAWGASIWLPLCLLLQSERAVWCILAPIPATAIIVAFSRWQVSPRKAGRFTDDVASWQQTPPSELFASVIALRRMPIATTALVSAALVEASIGAAAARAYSFAESLVLIATACIVWHTTPEPEPNTPIRHRNAARRRVGVLACFLLTCLSMTPFLQAGQSSLSLGSMVLAGARSLAPRVPRKMMAAKVYTGVVLLAPPLPKRKLIEPPPKSVLAGTPTLSKPTVIPFDGSYWFFQRPDSAPGKDAPVQRGDPIKNHIQSTNFIPLLMEAHQRLGSRVSAGCCGAISVSLTNGDNRLGVIEVEAVLREITPEGTLSHSLGVLPIQSSKAEKISIYRAPTQETLRFPLRVTQSDFRFNEITLIFHLGRNRNMANAEVKIKDFTLTP